MWDPEAQRLHYIDNTGRMVHSLDPATGRVNSLAMPSVITTLVLRAGGGAVVTLRTGLYFLDIETGRLELIDPLPEPPPFVFNDGKVDFQGRFVIGASTANFADPTPDGGLMSLAADGKLTRLDSGITFSNGPCWSPDGGTLYFSDSWRRTVFAYDYDLDAGTVANRRVFAETGSLGGLPDGATVDDQGLYWTAIYQAGKVAAFRPDGALELAIEMPVKLVSSVMFGGPDLNRLFVTTIANGALGEPVEPGAGALYVIDGLPARGLPENRYAG